MKIGTVIRVLPVLLAIVVIAACGTGAATPTAAPTAAPSSTPAPQTGKVSTFNGVQVTVPAAVASGVSGQIVAGAQGKDLPEFAIHPAYVEIKLADYPAQNGAFQGMVQVLPVADYKKISEVAGQRVNALQALLAQKAAAPDSEIPVLPVYNAAQTFRAQVKYLSFQNGAGVRFVTMMSQGLMPATNKEVFYTYQGLTSDGAYWVSAILPVKAAFLPADTGSAANPPAGGIAFPDLSSGSQGVPDKVKAYFQAVTEKVNATPADGFTPGLAALDAMMQSLRVAAP